MQKQSLLLMFILCLFMIPVFGYTQAAKKELTFDDVIKKRTFSSKGFDGIRSMNDGIHYCQLKNDSLNEYDYETGRFTRTIVTKKQLIPAGKTEGISMSGYLFSNDESKILFETEAEEIYRYSKKSFFYIYDIASGALMPLSENGKQRVPSFSPDGSKVAFVRDNNIYISELSGVKLKEYPITTDGMVNKIINGVPDWVYEEEFEFQRAYAWSPDGSKIAFYRFDESRVREYDLDQYGSLYPDHFRYKYPVPGEANSTVSISVYDILSGKTTPVELGAQTDIYIPRILWTADPARLCVFRMNRHQNRNEILIAEASTGKAKTILTEEDRCYVEINDNLKFLKNGKEFILTSEKDGYNHIYLYDTEGKLVRQLTKGDQDVTSVYGIDEKKGLVYCQTATPTPLDRQVWCVPLDGSPARLLTSRQGTNSADFSSNFSFFIHRWSDANTPAYITMNRSTGGVIRVLQDNAALISRMNQYNLSGVEFFSFPTDRDIMLNGCILKPPDFDPLKKYPVLFSVYGGPGSQSVLNSWRVMSFWNRFLAQSGIIIVNIDPRGTSSRGADFKRYTYLQLGKYETEDMVSAVRYLTSLPYVDKSRIGVWGWSYGGFMVLNCMTRASDYFSVGVAVAPVTHYKYYNDIYTERFMKTPKENPDGYEDNSPIKYVDSFKGKLLLIHGMADDNVHPQNSYDFMTAMVAADKYFDLQLYPNNNHFLRTGSNTSDHLYRQMTDYILKNLKGE